MLKKNELKIIASLDPSKRFYFVGIGGSGMSPLALFLHEKGFTVLGSDQSITKNTSLLLEKRILIHKSQEKENITKDDYVIYSSAIDCKTNKEILRAKELSIPILHRSDLLAILINTYPSVAVCGTHGKTTTSALVYHLLQSLVGNTSAIVGGVVKNQEQESLTTKTDYLVVEADESDGTIIKYFPKLIVLNNLEMDHFDYFKTYENLIDHFRDWIKNNEEAYFIYNLDDPILKDLSKIMKHKWSFSLLDKNADLYAAKSSIQPKESHTFAKITFKAQKEFLISVPLIGSHNIQNTLAAILVCEVLGIERTKAINSLGTFLGVHRRCERVYEDSSTVLIDDYAHNPGKIKALVDSIADAFLDYKIVCFFEPHRFSRIAHFSDSLASSFSKASFVFVLPVYSAGEEPIEGCSGKDFQKILETKKIVTSIFVENFENAIIESEVFLNEKTVFLTIGAGSITNLAYLLKDHIICKKKSKKILPT